MSKEKFDFNNYKDHTLTRPRDLAWDNWKSWKDSKPGDTVKGFVADAFYKPAETNSKGDVVYREQRGITIKQEDGSYVNVAVKYLPFILPHTDNLRVGDPIVVEFTEEIPSKEKGMSATKKFSYFGTNLPENANNKTVKQLTDEDKLAGGSVPTEPEETTEEQSGIEAF